MAQKYEEFEFKDYVNTRINLYICRALYNAMKKERYAGFKEKRAHEVLDINEKKLNRIFRCESKSKLTKDEINNISDMFNIPKTYFEVGSTAIIDIGISKDEWNTVINEEYGSCVPMESFARLDIDDVKSNIKKAVSSAVKIVHNEMRSGEVVYNICYYYKFGTAHKKSVGQQIKNVVASLERISYMDLMREEDLGDIENDIASIEEVVKKMKAVIEVNKLNILS